MKYFNVREDLICRLAGIEVNNVTPRNRNRIRTVTSVYFDKENHQYYDGLIEDVRETLAPIGLTISEPKEINNTICYTIVPSTVVDEPVAVITRQDMIRTICQHLMTPPELMEGWPEQAIVTTYNNLNTMLTTSANTRRSVGALNGYIMVDTGLQFSRCKITTDNVNNVVSVFEKFCSDLVNRTTSTDESVEVIEDVSTVEPSIQ